MSLLTQERIDLARREVASRSFERIELETALNWAARAVACFEKFIATGDLQWRDRGILMQHEAAEHAAEAGPGISDALIAELTAIANQVLGGHGDLGD